jgi:hypothetical protein
MLLNEFLKEHHEMEKAKAIIAQQQDRAAKQQQQIARQEEQIAALSAGLQKVSAEMALQKAPPLTAANN